MQKISNEKLICEMISYFSSDPKRIQHFIKVYEFAKLIGIKEKLDKSTQDTLETAAIVHDIGIKQAEEKYGSSLGKFQEKEGPAEAEKILKRLGYSEDTISRVCFLVGHHHTYDCVEGSDYQILIEADFLVNMFEDDLNTESIKNAYLKIFKTETGKYLCKTMFGLDI